MQQSSMAAGLQRRGLWLAARHNLTQQTLYCAWPARSSWACLNTLRTRSFKLFKRPFPGFLTFLTL